MAKNKLVHTRLLLGQVCAIFTVLPTFVFSICGIGLIIDFWSIKGPDAIWVGATAIFLAYFVGEYLINSQKLLDTNLRLENYIEVSGGDKRIDIEKNVKNLKIQKIIYGSSIIIWPIVLGGMSESFLNGAIGLSHLRVNEATVHIKQPYCEIAKQYFSTQYIQANDEKFCKLTNIAVLFHGIGTNSLIADINNQDNYLSIPSKEIVIKPTTFKALQPTAKSGG